MFTQAITYFKVLANTRYTGLRAQRQAEQLTQTPTCFVLNNVKVATYNNIMYLRAIHPATLKVITELVVTCAQNGSAFALNKMCLGVQSHMPGL